MVPKILLLKQRLWFAANLQKFIKEDLYFNQNGIMSDEAYLHLSGF